MVVMIGVRAARDGRFILPRKGQMCGFTLLFPKLKTATFCCANLKAPLQIVYFSLD